MTHLTSAGLSSLVAPSGLARRGRRVLCLCSLGLSKLAREDMQRNVLRAMARGGLGNGGPEGVNLGGLGARGRPFKEHLLIPQMFFVLSLAWVMLPPESDHDNPGPVS